MEPKELLVVELMELVEQEEVCQEGTITTTVEVAAAAAVEDTTTIITMVKQKSVGMHLQNKI